MPPDRAVVSDLDKIVDLGALADDSVAGRTAIDRCIGADLDIILDDDAPGLRNFLMPFRTRQITETVLTDASARMNDDTVADQNVCDRCASPDRAVAPNTDVGADNGAGSDQRPCADFGSRAAYRGRVPRGPPPPPRPPLPP